MVVVVAGAVPAVSGRRPSLDGGAARRVGAARSPARWDRLGAVELDVGPEVEVRPAPGEKRYYVGYAVVTALLIAALMQADWHPAARAGAGAACLLAVWAIGRALGASRRRDREGR